MERPVFFVATGTAANALALSATTPPGGVIFCHGGAHIFDAEVAAPEFFSVSVRKVVESYESDVIQESYRRMEDKTDVDIRKPWFL